MKLSRDFAALCAVTSFLWLAHKVKEHRTTEQPQLSSFLLLLIAAIAAFVAGFFSPWLPGNNGRYDEEAQVAKVARPNLPPKPRRYVLPLLVGSIIIRLQILYRVSRDPQCTSSGVELWLPAIIVLYELLPGRGPQSRSTSDDKDDVDDMGGTAFDALGAWITKSTVPHVVGVLLLTAGTRLASSQALRSTVFCPSHDAPSLVMLLQWIGLALDATIVYNAWRILAWARTTRLRLKTLAGILILSALGVGALYTMSRIFHPSQLPPRYHNPQFDAVDIIVDALAFSTFAISSALLATQGSSTSLAGVLLFATSLVATMHRGFLMGSWENVAPFTTYAALMLLSAGFTLFVYANSLRSIAFVPRALAVFLLVILSIAATIFTIVKSRKSAWDAHPISRLVYDARVAEDRWIIHASVSNSLRVAVSEYKARHHGRDPPPKFDVWYQFAKDRKSPIIDHFAQMENDILPFWGMPPKQIVEAIRRVGELPDIARAKIVNGKMLHKITSPPEHKAIMDNLAELVSSFAMHLPYPLEFAVNLSEQPRVQVPWEDMKKLVKAGKQVKALKVLKDSHRIVLSNRDDGPAWGPAQASYLWPPPGSESPGDPQPRSPEAPSAPIPPPHGNERKWGELMALACPAGSKMGSQVYWDTHGFCSECANPQSQGQFLTDWHRSHEICHQPDLLQLHGFYLTRPELPPLRELLPIFSRSKPDRFADILLPLPREPKSDTTDQDRSFDMKDKKLFWREPLDQDLVRSPSADLLRGGHRERLVHLVNNASLADTTTMVLPRSNKFAYERVSTADVNTLLATDIGFRARDEPCSAQDGCDDTVARHEFGPELSPAGNALAHQFVLVTDTNTGPPRDALDVLRSNSVPVLATIFREWWTERLIPWVHFVPVDIRFHALHSTLAYFSGINGKGGPKVNGREVTVDAHVDDARWIAEEGKAFAGRALRQEDMEVYLFRLMLEWGRVTHLKREILGFLVWDDPETYHPG